MQQPAHLRMHVICHAKAARLVLQDLCRRITSLMTTTMRRMSDWPAAVAVRASGDGRAHGRALVNRCANCTLRLWAVGITRACCRCPSGRPPLLAAFPLHPEGTPAVHLAGLAWSSNFYCNLLCEASAGLVPSPCLLQQCIECAGPVTHARRQGQQAQSVDADTAGSG